MRERAPKHVAPGPFRAEQIREGDPYELSRGHAIRCMSSGGRHGDANAAGAAVLASDPAVESSGVDVGFSPEPGMLRAPDVAVGNVPTEPGWVKGVPPLAVEYADQGQDEDELRDKIDDLLKHGTRYLWVVRLVGPRRVEIYEPGQRMRLALPGEELRAPGVLRNPVPVEALYDREAANEATLRNLLNRKGYESLEDLWRQGEQQGVQQGIEQGVQQGIEQGVQQGIEQGVQQGIEQGLRTAIYDLCEVLDIPLTAARRAQVEGLDEEGLTALRGKLKKERRWPPGGRKRRAR